jgi:hypothetical protein
MASFTLERDNRQHLVLIDEKGERYPDVAPVRAFPLSDPLHSISICDKDGREIVYVESLDVLEPATRTIVEEALGQREFVPVILKILEAPPRTEPALWHVQTDRGVTSFEVESEDSIYRREPRQVSIVDVRGIRYLIPDTKKLDQKSQRVLERFL